MPLAAFLFALLFASQLHAADFKIALAKTLKSEGGYVNDKAVRGGETYRGITRASHPEWKGWVLVDSVKSMLGYENTRNAPSEVRHKIDRALARQPKMAALVRNLYRKEFWIPLKLDKEPDQKKANRIFDRAVKRGIFGAKKKPKKARKIHKEN